MAQKNLYFKNNMGLVHFAYSVNASMNVVSLSINPACSSFKNDNTTECVLCTSVQEIGKSAFENCSELKIVEWVSINCNNDSDENSILSTDKNGCYTNAVLKGNLHIQYQAFKNCGKLHTVVFPKCDGLIIEKEAFASCRSLRTVVFFESNNTEISSDAFAECDKKKLVFVVENNPEAVRFARELGIECVEI